MLLRWLLLRRLLVVRDNYLKQKNMKLPPSYYLFSNEFDSEEKKKERNGVVDFLNYWDIKGVCFPSFPEIYDFKALVK